VPILSRKAVKLSSRLLLPLLLAVSVVMTLSAGWSLVERQRTLVAQGERETRAYAVALGLALEPAFRDPDRTDVQQIIDRISREAKIYGVLVYDAAGRPLFASAPVRLADSLPSARVRRVVADGREAAMQRTIGEQEVYALVQPVMDGGGRVVGAFEVAQPLSFLYRERLRVTVRYVASTLLLVAAVTVLIRWMVGRLIAEPVTRLVGGVRALGRGELTHRIAEDFSAAELTELAGEFNRMTVHLADARRKLLAEAEGRVELERRLRQTEKLAAVGRLAAGLAHEIGAPLHVIRGRAETMLRREQEPEVRRRNLGIIVEQIGRITLIVRNLLEFSRRREPQVQDVDLAAVAERVLELLEGEFARAAIRVVREGSGPALIRGDPHLLHQVVLNIVLNAVQALESVPGKRELAVRFDEGALDGVHPGEYVAAVALEVEDSGPGIPEDVLPQIFEPFFTTRTGGQGTGLGLAVAVGIVEEHGGRIEAANRRGPDGAPAGAVFRVLLPAAGEALAHA
jgi:signal transduction histidine kinase